MHPRALYALALGLSLVVLASLAAIYFLSPRQQTGAVPSDVAADASWAEPAALPTRAADPATPGVAGLVDPAWLTAESERTGIAERALAAYAGAALAKSEQMPGCGLGWNTIAAIGFAESRHGTHGGSTVGADGTVLPAIIGIALDGGSTEVVTDTDGGVLDGDPLHDRAVGPMQLIPQTWANWHNDANLDGIEDPQNIDDAAVATANYLCRASGDMTTESGWRAGITAYNSAPAYITKVANVGMQYAE